MVSALVMLLTIVGEEWAPLKNWLKVTFSHHWLGKSYLSVALFALVVLVAFPFTSGMRATRALWFSFVATIISAGTMTVYFILHTLHFV
jgi:hypothetical protein